MPEFAEWLRNMIEGRGATLRKAAEYAGVSSASLSDLATGKTKPSYETCLRLAKYFYTSPKEVLALGGHEEITPFEVVELDLADPRWRLVFARIGELSSEDQRLILEHVVLPAVEGKERAVRKAKQRKPRSGG